MTLTDLDAALKTVTPNVFRYFAVKQEAPYIVWAEDGQAGALHANNRVIGQAIGGTIDYFTRLRDDPNVSAIQDKLNSLDLTWGLNSIQYEDDTRLIHYEWWFEVEAWHG